MKKEKRGKTIKASNNATGNTMTENQNYRMMYGSDSTAVTEITLVCDTKRNRKSITNI